MKERHIKFCKNIIKAGLSYNKKGFVFIFKNTKKKQKKKPSKNKKIKLI